MRIVVYGAGAVGGLVGALLAEAGEDVHLIARGAHGEAMARSGLVVESQKGRPVIDVPVASSPGEAAIGPGDTVLLGMKSQDTGDALAHLRRVARPDVAVVCLQNGVDNERAALRLFPRVYGVCVMCPAGHLEPGVVQAFSSPIPGLLDVGRFPSGTDERSHGLAEAFRSAGFDSIEREDVMRWKYCKLLMNLGNAVEAAFLPSDRAEVSALARDEGMACLQAAGIAFASAEEDGARRGTLMKLGPVGGRRREGGSSWQSLQRGTGSIESDYLNGEVVLLGRIHGVPTPVNALLQEVAWEMAWSGAEPATLSAAQFFDRLGSHSERP